MGYKIILPDKFWSRVRDKVVAEVMDATKHVFDIPRYWGSFGVTRRKSGEVVQGGFRDIVDTRELRDSMSVTNVSPKRAYILVGAKHAAIVYFGVRGRKHKVPGRPWFRHAVDHVNTTRS
jgi:hypothetical protein